MKILLLAFGSRGDVQPILSLSDGLVAAGYTVTIGASTDFREWIESRGNSFAGMGVNMHELLNSNMGTQWIENSANPFQEAANMKRVIDANAPIIGDVLLEISQDADVLISNLPTFGLAQAVAEKYGKPHIRVMLAPLTPSRRAESTMMPILNRKSILNRVAGHIGIYMMYWVNRESTNAFRRQLGLWTWRYGNFAYAWNQMLVLYGVSPSLMPPDPNWPANTVVTGYWFDKPQTDWQPPARLTQFLEEHPQPIYIGFGSMAAQNPQQTLDIFTQALEQAGKPGIIYSRWNGLQADQLPPQVLHIDGAPHEWLFPRMGALIHHGGAGTTAAGVAAGVPATVIPHMADQPYWGRRLYELGIGAHPIRRHQLSPERLAKAIRAMTDTPDMQNKAQQLAQEMNRENGVATAVGAIERILEPAR